MKYPALVVLLGLAVGCHRHDSDVSEGGAAMDSPILWVGLTGAAPPAPPPPGPAPILSVDELTFEMVDTIWYAGNLDPLRTACTDVRVTGPEDQLLLLINQHRLGLAVPAPALVEDPVTRKVSRAHSKHMAVHAPPFFADDGPELVPPSLDPATPPVTPFDRLFWSNVNFPNGAAEAIAAGAAMTPAAALAAMLANPAYQAAIEDPLWVNIGVGFWTGDHYTVNLH